MAEEHQTRTSLGASYELVCTACGKAYDDDGYRLRCDGEHEDAMLTTRYSTGRFVQNGQASGLAKYAAWLPLNSDLLDNAQSCIVFRSEALARELGMENLWIAFSGYWPERGIQFATGTFKELEANVLIARLPPSSPPMVIASVGNTAAALARISSLAERPCVVVIPEFGLDRIRFAGEIGCSVRVVCVEKGSYRDAIDFGQFLCRRFGWVWPGGALNVATRDGLATVMLAAFDAIGSLPEHYFQAVGSGAGGIAAWEASRRLQPTGQRIPRLTLCQNAELAPIASELSAHSVGDLPIGIHANGDGEVPYADELTNPKPLVRIKGGVKDALADTRGNVRTATAREAQEGRNLFAEVEGVDIEPGPAVAVACLRNAIADGSVSPDSLVLLNVTGGGRSTLERTGRNKWPLRVEAVSLGQNRELSAERVFKSFAKTYR
ncbi:cysteate synthase [Mycobacterium europaeum]|uniref:cysteate synthase n=1 Tax=Mycobacterium europaeum TaxID=761804 RepID=UPI002ADF6533|nr:cysteate synthase [Mycobacterium europaeum]MEA1160907.1 cysteate synthase [Mycobacterium europaeum]